jgi:hypothetical protein
LGQEGDLCTGPRIKRGGQVSGHPTSMTKKRNDVYFAGLDWLGRKTNAFYGNMMHVLDLSIPQSVTNDIWMMRACPRPY